MKMRQAEADLDAKVGGNIAAVRRRRGWSQTRLGDAVGRSRAAIGNIEAGRFGANGALLIMIAQALDTSVSALARIEPPASSHAIPV